MGETLSLSRTLPWLPPGPPLLRQPYLFVATSPPPLSALTGDRPRPLAFLDRLTAAPFVLNPVDTPVSSTPLVSHSLLKLRSPYGSPASPFRSLPPSPGPTFPWRVPLSPPVSPCRFRPHLLGSLLVFGGGLLPALLPSYYVLFTFQRLPFYVSVPRSLPSLTSDVSSINSSLIPPPFLVSSAFPFHSNNDDTFHKATTIFDHCVLFVGVDLSILESPKLAECFACCIVLSLMNNNNDNENI